MKVSDLTELSTAPEESDLLYIVDGGVSKKITALNLFNLLESSLTSFEIHTDNIPTELTLDSITINKQSGVAGLSALYEAESTSTAYIGWMGPSDISSSYAIQFSSTEPAGQFPIIGTPSGTGDPNGNPTASLTWATMVDTQFLKISEAIDGGTPPASLATITSTNSVQVRKFDGASQDEDVYFSWLLPADLDSTSGIKFRVIYIITESNTPSSNTFQFEMSGLAFEAAAGDGLAESLGTSISSNSGSVTLDQYDIGYTAWSDILDTDNITNYGDGRYVIFKLYRDIDDTDDYAYDVGVIGIELKYKREYNATF
jgi:hypothetical protein